MNKKIQRCISAFLAVAAVALFGIAVAGCGSADGDAVNCTQNIAPSLVVTVTDATTGLPAAANATVTATDGDFTEALRASNFTVNPDGTETLTAFSGPYERAGTYTVRVSRAGYADAERAGIRVVEGRCHVNTQELTIALTPLASQAAQ